MDDGGASRPVQVFLKMNAAVKLSSPATREFWEIPVLFEDEHLLALDKPAGLLTFPDPLVPQQPNLMRLLHAAIAAGKPWARERHLNFWAPPTGSIVKPAAFFCSQKTNRRWSRWRICSDRENC